MKKVTMKRVIVYIDGFNLYYGMKARGWKRYYWLDVKRLAENLLKPDQQLMEIKYFTARLSGTKPAKRKRQQIYLEAIETLKGLRIFYGHYLQKTVTCFNCHKTWKTHEEKMTDVCIGTEMLMDAFNDRFDTALVISGDSDLVPPIEAIRSQFSPKRIVAAFPPDRSSMRLRQTANAYFEISEYQLRRSLLPEQVVKPDGYVLSRPAEWQKNVKP